MSKYPMDYDLPHRGLSWLEWYADHKVYHCGQDFNFGIGDADLGNPIYAFSDGTVEYISPQPTTLNSQNGGFGWFIILYHPEYQLWSRYAHLNKLPIPKLGEPVKEGEQIAECGKTGTKSAHLHFEIFNVDCYNIQSTHWRKFGYYPCGKTKEWVNRHYVDPMAFISKEMQETAKEWYTKHFPNQYDSKMTEEECEKWRTFAQRIIEWTK